MTPIYFPFTYIPEPVARRLKKLFGQVTVYLPVPAAFIPGTMRQLKTEGRINLRVPCPDDGNRLIQALRDFKIWGERHYGDGTSLKEVFSDGFYNQTFTAQIQSDILKQGKTAAPSPDPGFAARLFLTMAQERDAHQYDLEREMTLSTDAERDLFARMNGQEKTPDSSVEQIKTGDYGTVMTAARLSAWSHLFYKDAPESCFLVTNSRAAVEQMMEPFSDIRQLTVFEEISCELSNPERAELAQYMAELRHAPDPEADAVAIPSFKAARTGGRIRLSLFLLPHAGPAEIFAVLSHSGGAGHTGISNPFNTVIALCEL